MGWWLAALPIGLIAGNLAGVRFVNPLRQRRMIALAAIASPAPCLASAASPSLDVAMPMLVLAGMVNMYSLGRDALVRRAAAARLFARTRRSTRRACSASKHAAFVLAGAVAGIAGPGTAIAIAGACGIAIVIVLRPRRRGPRVGSQVRDFVPVTGDIRP